MRTFALILVSFTLLSSTTAIPERRPDPTCKTGIRDGQACCPSICRRCGGKNCGVRSEILQTDCCPTSILTGARLCSKKSPPCKLTPIGNSRTKKCRSYSFRFFSHTGANSRELRTVVRSFRSKVRARGGVRVINWEGSAPFALPEGYYNKSGVLFKSKGNYHAVSNAPKTLDDKFSSYLPEIVTSRFQTYSGKRLFTPVMDNSLTVSFIKHGKRAKVTAFGAVFVDVSKKATLKVFDVEGCLIARVKVPKMPGGLSFVGVLVKGIGKVELKLGTVNVSSFARNFRKTAVGDVVVLDDFIFGKPY